MRSGEFEGIYVDQKKSLSPRMDVHHIKMLGFSSNGSKGVLFGRDWAVLFLAEEISSTQCFRPDVLCCNVPTFFFPTILS